MERAEDCSSRRSGAGAGAGGVFVSCGECLKLKLRRKTNPTARSRRRRSSVCDITTTPSAAATRRQQQTNRVGGFKYDPLSYAQNFDDSAVDEVDEAEIYSHGFTSRFAAPIKSSSLAASGAVAPDICVN